MTAEDDAAVGTGEGDRNGIVMDLFHDNKIFCTSSSTTFQYASSSTFPYTSDNERGFTFPSFTGRKTSPDLAARIRGLYMEMLDTPLTADMLIEWDKLQASIKEVEAVAKKYTRLIEKEIASKLD